MNADTALAFATEILGWNDAEVRPMGHGLLIVWSLKANAIFNTCDLDAVLEAVRIWCQENEASFDVHYREDGYGAHVWFSHNSRDQNLTTCHAGKPLHILLMDACVEASRALKSCISRKRITLAEAAEQAGRVCDRAEKLRAVQRTLDRQELCEALKEDE